jgi:hypothetical protein
MVTPEGVTINVYVDGVTPQQVYEVLLANGLQAHVRLATVNVRDNGLTYATVGSDCVNSVCSPAAASIEVDIDDYTAHPNLIVGHEYGHVWDNHHRWSYWEGSFDSYLQARGLLGDSRLGSSKCWRPEELIADDYRQLFGAPETTPGVVVVQCNRYIPTPDQVPGLRDFLALTWTAGNPPPAYTGNATPVATPTAGSTPPSTPSPTPTPAVTPTATPVVTATPVPPPALTTTVFVAKGWQRFVAPISGTANPHVYLSKGTKLPTTQVTEGNWYWARGPVTISISQQP